MTFHVLTFIYLTNILDYLDNFLDFYHDYNHNSCILFDIELLNDFFYHIAYIFDLWQGSFCHLVYDQVGHSECIHL